MAVRSAREATAVKTPLKPVAVPASSAQPKTEPPAQARPQPQKKRRKRAVTMIVTLAVLTAGGAGAGWMYLERQKEQPGAAVPAEKPVFVNLEQFTVNLQPEPEVTDQYLQVALVVKVKNDATAEAIRDQMPEVRNRLLLLLSGRKPSELVSTEGKRQLSRDILGEVKQPLPPALQPQVAAVFFTAFVIQ